MDIVAKYTKMLAKHMVYRYTTVIYTNKQIIIIIYYIYVFYYLLHFVLNHHQVGDQYIDYKVSAITEFAMQSVGLHNHSQKISN
jgi:hypothetical protein